MKEITITISQEQLNGIKDCLGGYSESKKMNDKELIEFFIESNLCMDKEGNSW
jgi:hypothetical protein